VTEPSKNQLTPPELETFHAGLHKVHSRDDQHVTEPHIVVHSTDAYWLTAEQTGNLSHIGLLRCLHRRPNRARPVTPARSRSWLCGQHSALGRGLGGLAAYRQRRPASHPK
jgi:hypothetical protein